MTNKTASDAQGAYTLVKRQTHTEMVERYGNYSFWIENALSPGFRLLLNPSLKKIQSFSHSDQKPWSHSWVFSCYIFYFTSAMTWWVSFKPHHLRGYTLVQVTTISHLYCCMSPSTGLHVPTLSPSFWRSFFQQKSQNNPVKTLSQTMSLLCFSPSKIPTSSRVKASALSRLTWPPPALTLPLHFLLLLLFWPHCTCHTHAFLCAGCSLSHVLSFYSSVTFTMSPALMPIKESLVWYRVCAIWYRKNRASLQHRSREAGRVHTIPHCPSA